MKPYIFFVSPEGKLPQGIKETLARVIPTFAGKKVRLTLEEAKPHSSDPQRRYYFGVIVESIQEMFKDAGTVISKDEMHEWLKANVGKLYKEVITPDGEVTYILGSYNDLTTSECESYHTQCRAWAAERGCDISEPNELNN